MDAIGIRMTFNENYILKNTSSNRNYGLRISYRNAAFFGVSVATTNEHTIAKAGQSIFIPMLLYPQIYTNLNEHSYGGIAESINIFTLPSLGFNYSDNAIVSQRLNRNAINCIEISIDNTSYNTTKGQNITFDIYEIYF